MADPDRATGLLVGQTKAKIIELQTDAINGVGMTITSYGDGGRNVSKERGLSVTRTLNECLFALRDLEPDIYGLNRAGRRVHANFNTAIVK